MRLRIVPVEDQFSGFLKSPKGGVIGTTVGPRGLRGEQGEQGVPGNDGAPGNDGDTGPANELTIGTVTPGETASAEITGEAPSQELNLVLPQGEKGETGDTGLTGPPGGVDTVNTRSGAVTLTKSDVGLGSVDNTSDAGKPVSTATQTALDAKEATTNKGAANGYAPLGADSKVPAAYMASYVDDVLEFTNFAAFPGTGETGKIYTDLATNKVWRWGGSSYTEISPSPGSTDAVPEGSTNKYYTDTRADARVTAGITGKVSTSRSVLTGTGLTGGGDLTADRTHAVDFGTGSGKVTQGNDSRLSDTRTPTDNSVTTAKIVDANVTRAKLATSGTPDGTKFLRDDMSWQAASGGGLGTPAVATVTTAEATSSTTYTDLATTTDTVTATIGASGAALVSIFAHATNASATGQCFMGFAMSGANTASAADQYSVTGTPGSATRPLSIGFTFLRTGLTPGSTVFKAKYKEVTGAATFANRYISVLPL